MRLPAACGNILSWARHLGATVIGTGQYEAKADRTRNLGFFFFFFFFF